MTEAPLQGIRVVDLTHVLAGPYCTYLLALLGAEIIKVEVPGGEWLRHQGSSGAGSDARPGPGFLAQSAGKRMIAVDIRIPEGAAVVRALAERCDVFVENFTPGVAARAGLDDASLRALNPRLVYASITGFGQDGPFARWPAYDHIIQAMSGLMSMTGTPESGPLRVGPPVVDYLTGLHAAFAIMAALAARERTGAFAAGRRRDAGLRVRRHVVGDLRPSQRRRHPEGGRQHPGERQPILRGVPDRGRAAGPRRQHGAPIRTPLRGVGTAGSAERSALRQPRRPGTQRAPAPHRDRAGADRTARRRMGGASHGSRCPGRPGADDPEAVAEPHTGAREIVHDVGGAKLFGTAFKLNGAPFAPGAAPRACGADTEAVLAELGYDGDKIARLAQRGAIGIAR